MDVLLDTHVLIWAVSGADRLSRTARDIVVAPGTGLLMSAVSAWEFADLRARGLLPALADFAVAADRFSIRVLDLPGGLWRLADRLPNIHGDPMDRMLIAHAIAADLTLVTADETIRSYPVSTLW